jgi:hypothetical protein
VTDGKVGAKVKNEEKAIKAIPPPKDLFTEY